MSEPLLAIDPGPTDSGWCVYDPGSGKPSDGGIDSNDFVLTLLDNPFEPVEWVAIEMIASYGMPVSRSVFDTCVWIGRFMQASAFPVERLTRGMVKMHICGQMRAKDANITAALYDRYGGDRKAAVGVKAAPGPCYGFKGDMWAALALAITAAETGERYE